ncbi:nucleotidyltransferase domain-containing protein [Variovorax ginsengisoli]|uniref:Nucleotidyltransferase domain-containing protein n=1 Tax=Variovorax ginsengisoli TaxID=363844 RepID=A0ABT8SBP6_9BURK|nr:nucleotidyltransferase domain-containing protein [Variovorax ginsengisoli]MDN8617168.1 nucleotidyltransferase domain-containing protein [Variovorax ginsengisoli]MDO1536338.1 nucleotidyltransferase domain-containing protein [Variovorax ginsengisoli]
MATVLRRPIAEILRDRSDSRRAQLRPQVERTLAELRRRGVVCEVVGSYARTSSIFDSGSDLDVLIESRSNLSETEVWDIAWANLPDVDVDLVFADQLPSSKVALMKEHARG